MKYIVITSEGCSRCEMIKNILTQNNIEFEEKSVLEAGEIVEDLAITEFGTIVDTEEYKVVPLQSLI